MSDRNWLAKAPFGVGLIVVLALSFVAQTNYQRKAEATYAAAREEYEHSKQIMTENAIAPRPYTGDKSYREEWRAEHDLEAQRSMSDWSYWTMLATWFGVVLLGATLWETTRTTLAAGDAATAAKDAVAQAQSTAMQQLSAYVTLIGAAVELVNIRDHGLGFRISVTLRNSGQTPAYNFSTWIGVPLIDQPEALPFTEPLALAERNGTSITGPGADAHLVQVVAASEAQIAALRARTQKLFVWGGADYTDIFGRRRFFVFRCVNGEEIVPPQGQGWALGPHRLGYETSEQPS